MRESEQTITLQTHLYTPTHTVACIHTHTHTHAFLQRAVLCLSPITCQIHFQGLFVTMKQPAAGRQIKTLYLTKTPLFTDAEKVSDIRGLLKTHSEF